MTRRLLLVVNLSALAVGLVWLGLVASGGRPVKLLPEQLLVHARVWVGRGEPLPYQIGAPLVIAFDEALEEIKRLRERIVVLEQERFE